MTAHVIIEDKHFEILTILKTFLIIDILTSRPYLSHKSRKCVGNDH